MSFSFIDVLCGVHLMHIDVIESVGIGNDVIVLLKLVGH